jgi:hypothetical protein
MMASVIFAAAAVLLFAGMIAWMIRPRHWDLRARLERRLLVQVISDKCAFPGVPC